MAAAGELEVHDVVDDGREDHGEERTDVDQQEDFAKTPDEGESHHDGDGEEDVAADSGVTGIVG
jgi:hypothetical protein